MITVRQDWWFFCSSYVEDGVREELVFYVVSRNGSTSNPLIRFISGSSRVYTITSFIKPDEEQYYFNEKIYPKRVFSGDARSSYEFSVGETSSKKNRDGYVLRIRTPKKDITFNLTSVKERVPILGGIGLAHSRVNVSGYNNLSGNAIKGEGYIDWGSDPEWPITSSHSHYEWSHFLFDDSSELMLLLVPWDLKDCIYGLYVDSSGKHYQLTREDIIWSPQEFWKSPKSKTTYPIAWKCSLPKYDIHFYTKAHFQDQEVRDGKVASLRHWFGSGDLRGEKNGIKIGGHAFFGVVAKQSTLKEYILSFFK